MKEVEKTRYSDSELQEFKEIIQKKLAITTEELNNLLKSLQSSNENGTDDTGSVYKTIEDGSSTLQKESISQMAARLKKFIMNLQAAAVRIENHTYGICRVTGKLISKERLRAVPHTTQSMEAKVNQYK
jgi:DnaK suppressor protein